MMNQPYEHVNKLRESCKRMKKCRDAAMQATKRKRNAQESMDAIPEVSVTDSVPLAAKLQG